MYWTPLTLFVLQAQCIRKLILFPAQVAHTRCRTDETIPRSLLRLFLSVANRIFAEQDQLGLSNTQKTAKLNTDYLIWFWHVVCLRQKMPCRFQCDCAIRSVCVSLDAPKNNRKTLSWARIPYDMLCGKKDDAEWWKMFQITLISMSLSSQGGREKTSLDYGCDVTALLFTQLR